MSPTHNDPSRPDRRAKAPYNFVRLPEAVITVPNPPDQDHYDPDLLTGSITCTLTTASPMYVRAYRTLQQYRQAGADGRPPQPPESAYGEEIEDLIIPGSSLRGMLRTLVEIISFSRLAPVTDKALFFRTLDDTSLGEHAYRPRMTGGDPNKDGYHPLAKAGYLIKKDHEYVLRPAQSISGVQYFKVQQDAAGKVFTDLNNMAVQKEDETWKPNKEYKWKRSEIWFKPTAPKSHLPNSPTWYAEVSDLALEEPKSDKGYVKGVFIASGWVPARRIPNQTPKPGKHMHWIIAPPLDNDKADIRVGQEDIDLYREQGAGTTQEIENQGLSVFPQNHESPIACFYISWQDEHGIDRLAFGHTAMFRLPYQHSPAGMIKMDTSDAVKYDLAEALFGRVDQPGDSRGSVAGRVFISDAKHIPSNEAALLVNNPIRLKVLSGPKPTAFQHYLTQDHPDDKNKLFHYDDSPEKTTLRGHKLYWHKPHTALTDIKARDEDVQKFPKQFSAAVKPVNAGQKFRFTIRFENIRLEEMGALLWVLSISENGYRLKIGMGKPYGMGSVAVLIDDESMTTNETSLINADARYTNLFTELSWEGGTNNPDDRDATFREAREAFEKLILRNNVINPSHKYQSLEQIPRIQDLLALLSWDGLPQDWSVKTSYMTLDEFTGKRGTGYDKRPVLPGPSAVKRGEPARRQTPPQNSFNSSGRSRSSTSEGHANGQSRANNSRNIIPPISRKPLTDDSGPLYEPESNRTKQLSEELSKFLNSSNEEEE